MRFFRLWLLALALSIAAFGQATVVVMNVEGDGHGKVNVATIFPRLLAMGNCSKAKPSAKLLPEWKPVFRSFTQGQFCRSVMEMNFANLSMLGDQLKAVSFPPALSMSAVQSGNEFTIDVQKGAKTGAGRHPVLPLEVMAMQIGVQVSVPEIVEVKGGGGFTPRPNPRTVQMQFPMKGAFDVAVVARLVNVPPLPPPRSSGGKGGPGHATLPDWVMPLLVTLALGVLAALAYFLWPVIADILGFGAAEGVAEEVTPSNNETPENLSVDQDEVRARLAEQLRLRERQLELGKNPEKGGFYDEEEGIGGVHIEQALGRMISRSNVQGVDFVDPVLGPVSLKGPLPASGAGDIAGLARSVIKDVTQNSATKTCFVDLTGLSAEQAATVKATVNAGISGTAKRVFFLE